MLLGHATRSPRWDIPKGLAEPGEAFRDAAVRELAEETGITAPASALYELGVHPYLRGKDLALFTWSPEVLPEPRTLHCASGFAGPRGTWLPEFDRFDLFAWPKALTLVGKNMARVLGSIQSIVGAG